MQHQRSRRTSSAHNNLKGCTKCIFLCIMSKIKPPKLKLKLSRVAYYEMADISPKLLLNRAVQRTKLPSREARIPSHGILIVGSPPLLYKIDFLTHAGEFFIFNFLLQTLHYCCWTLQSLRQKMKCLESRWHQITAMYDKCA